MAKLVWEKVEGEILDRSPADSIVRCLRARVPGGWLLRFSPAGKEEPGTIFLPDPNHEWQ